MSDLDLIAADPSLTGTAEDPSAYVISIMKEAQEDLDAMLLATPTPIGQLVALKTLRAQLSTVRTYCGTAHLSREAELATSEVLRRAERATGLAVRRGQAEGTIRERMEFGGNQNVSIAKVAPYEFATKGELVGSSQGRAGIYDLTDGITEDQFEEAIRVCRDEERVLTRANVARYLGSTNFIQHDPDWIPDWDDRGGEASIRRRHIIREDAARGYSSRQISEKLGTLDVTIRRLARQMGIEIPADKAMHRTTVHDSSRIVEEVTHILEGAAMGLELVYPEDLDPTQVKEWVASLTASTRAINRLVKKMKETTT